MKIPFNPAGFEKALKLIKTLDNRHRLRVLCLLCGEGRTVSEMAKMTGLSLSAMSQHLSVMRKSGLVDTQKNHQTITYNLKGREIKSVIEVLKKLYCNTKST